MADVARELFDNTKEVKSNDPVGEEYIERKYFYSGVGVNDIGYIQCI